MHNHTLRQPISVLFSKCLLILFPVVFLSCPAPALASNNNTQPITLTQQERAYVDRGNALVVYNPSWPPYDYRDSSGHHAGLAADLLHLISDKSGLQIKAVSTADWGETMELIRKGEFDLVSLLNAKGEKPKFVEYTAPILVEPLVLVAGPESTISSINSLTGPLALVRGYITVESLRNDYPDVRIINAYSTEETLQLVLDGEADATLMTAIEARHLLGKERWKSLSVVSQTPYSYRLVIGVRKDNAPLLSIMQKGVAGITEAEREKFLAKWMADSPHSDDGFSVYLKWILGGVFAAILGIFIYRKCISIGKCPGPKF